MVFDNRILNDMENNPEASAQANNPAVEADIVPTVEESVEISNEADVRAAFRDIRQKVQKSSSSADLIVLYRDAGGLIKLLDTPPFQERVGDQLEDIRRVAEEEFALTARELNKRVPQINSRSHFAEKWGD